MKKILLPILFFVNLFAAMGQDALNRTWFLTELIIGGENVSIPNEEDQIGFPTLLMEKVW